MDLAGKVAVIIGGSKGIGLSVAKNLIEYGASRVIIASRDVKTGVEAKKRLNEMCGVNQNAVHIRTDITSTNELKSNYLFIFIQT